MKLKRFRVTNFRSVIDSGWINCDNVTTLVGINESGKSNIMLALWKLKPASGGAIDYLHDLPVKKLAEYRNKLDKIVFIEAVFSLDDSYESIEEELNIGLNAEDEFYLARLYDGNYRFYLLDNEKQKQLQMLQTPIEDEDGNKTEPEYTNKQILEYFCDETPTFVYYSNYGNLSSKIYLPYAIKWLNGGIVQGIETNEDQVRTLKVLFEYVKLKPDEILELGKEAKDIAHASKRQEPNKDDIEKAEANKEKRSLLLQSAGTQLTRSFHEWWKQGEYTFRFSADGDYFQIWVSDEKRPEEVALELRSTGLQWFLSFYLIFLVECQTSNYGSILLLDEAGLTLHPLAQKDLATFFIKLSENNQIINTTHSPFIIDTESIDRCRVVYSDESGATVVSENLREGAGDIGTKSVYAVHAALGLTVSDVILQGSQIVIVEGISDQFYLTGIKNVLIREKKIAPDREIVFAPSGGVKGVLGLTGLVSAKQEDLPYVILDSDKCGDDFRKKLETGLYKDQKNKLLSVKDFAEIEQAEIEDLIPYECIEKSVEKLLGVPDEEDEFEVEQGKPVVPQIETYAADHGLELYNGWKVDVAKAFKRKMSAKKRPEIPTDYINKWLKLFVTIQPS